MQHHDAAASTGSDTADQVSLDLKALELVEQYQQAMAAASHPSSSDVSPQTAKGSSRHGKSPGAAKRRGKGAVIDQGPISSSTSGSVSAELLGVLEDMHGMFGQLLQDNYQQVGPMVASFWQCGCASGLHWVEACYCRYPGASIVMGYTVEITHSVTGWQQPSMVQHLLFTSFSISSALFSCTAKMFCKVMYTLFVTLASFGENASDTWQLKTCGCCCCFSWTWQVDDADVQAFSTKLLHELSELVEAAAAAQEADVEGLCQLCDREMPLTKHHLIPRWAGTVRAT
jgi:hypothetical protein